jgi:hypothetical protein
MKKQTGIAVDALAWEAYRDLCRKERLRPGEAFEKFIQSCLDNESVSAVLNLLETMRRSRIEGLEAYARVLLHYLRKGWRFIEADGEDEVSVQAHLLDCLRSGITSVQLRLEIEEALKKVEE